jgi:hypothetical protein
MPIVAARPRPAERPCALARADRGAQIFRPERIGPPLVGHRRVRLAKCAWLALAAIVAVIYFLG